MRKLDCFIPGRVVGVLAAVGLATWCWTASPARSSVEEVSVRPGINVEFLKPAVAVDQWVERFEREGREIYDRREAIVRGVGLRPGMRVADIGAGTGLFVPYFARAVGEHGRVYAVDIAADFLEHIGARARDEGLSQVTTVLCTERSVALPRQSIDLAFICDTYHHFEYPRSTLATLQAALRPGGEIVLIDFKRIPGQSSDWILEHVRAGQEVFVAEIEEAGFEMVEELDLLDSNYMLRFRRKGG